MPREVVGILCMSTKKTATVCNRHRNTHRVEVERRLRTRKAKACVWPLMVMQGRVGLGDHWRSSSLEERRGHHSTQTGEELHPSDASASGANQEADNYLRSGLRLCRRRHLPLTCKSCSSLARERSSRRIPCGSSASAIESPLLLPSLLFLHLPLPPCRDRDDWLLSSRCPWNRGSRHRDWCSSGCSEGASLIAPRLQVTATENNPSSLRKQPILAWHRTSSVTGCGS